MNCNEVMNCTLSLYDASLTTVDREASDSVLGKQSNGDAVGGCNAGQSFASSLCGVANSWCGAASMACLLAKFSSGGAKGALTSSWSMGSDCGGGGGCCCTSLLAHPAR